MKPQIFLGSGFLVERTCFLARAIFAKSVTTGRSSIAKVKIINLQVIVGLIRLRRA